MEPSGAGWLRDLPLQRKALLAYGSMLFLLAVACLAFYIGQQDTRQARERATRGYDAVLGVARLQADFGEQVNALRAYAIGGEPTYLERFGSRDAGFRERIDVLATLVADAGQRDRVQRLRELAADWRSNVALPVIAQVPDRARRDELLAEVTGARTLELADAVRRILGEIGAHEERALGARLDDLRRRSHGLGSLALLTLSAGALLGAAIIWFSAKVVTDPLVQLAVLMRGLAHGDHDRDVPEQERNDELGDLARGLEAFRRAQVALQAVQTELQQKNRDLEQASRYKSEFLANMSHELRTPLNSLLILARDLLDNAEGNLSADQREAAQIIHDSGQNLLSLINDILDLSKVEAGKLRMLWEELPLVEVARAMERAFRHVAEARRVTFAVRLDPRLALSGTLRTDGARLRQILGNLLGNAFKFTAAGEVTLRIDPTGDAARPGWIAFAVTDTGIGIPADKLERIFEAFEQVDGTTSRRYGGTGLGLSICRGLAQRLGGELRVASQPGTGSVFTLLLPPAAPDSAGMQAAVAPRPAVTAEPPPAVTPSDLGGATVLIVDDDMRNVFALSKALRARGLQVLVAQDGHKAIALLDQNPQVDWVLMDSMVPGMDGHATTREIRSQPRWQSLPVIAVTARAMAEDRDKSLAAGATDYLTKPVDIERLMAMMREHRRARG